MDVTSMLNGASVAAERPKSAETKLPTRNRTPWDAGGYSLPIITHLPPINTAVAYGPSMNESTDGAQDALARYRGRSSSHQSPEEISRSLLSPDSLQRSPYETVNQHRLLDDLQSPQEGNQLPGDSHQSLAEALRLHIPSDSTQLYRSRTRNTSIDSSGHYLSDSRSSLSSFTSQLSLNSATHSRISSTSTVSGFHHLNNNNPTSSATEPVTKTDKATTEGSQFGQEPMTVEMTDESTTNEKSLCEMSQPYLGPRLTSTLALPSMILANRQQLDSPAESTEKPARTAERRSSEQYTKPEQLHIQSEDMPSNPRRPFVEGEWALKGKHDRKTSDYATRPVSPSDAVMIRRVVYQHRLPEKRKFKSNPPGDINVFSEDHGTTRGVSRLRSVSNGHKRAISAPNFSGVMSHTTRKPGFDIPGPTSEPTPPASVHGDAPSPQAPILPDSPAVNPSVMSKPRCMYIADCATQSTPRKAISHILGRNKMCTRQIPPDVWVRYCRKHYQRARYRNGAGWGPLQCDLVREQINRLDIMTEENKRKGSGPMVRDWTLALRKREQNRVNALGDKKAKKVKEEDEEDTEDEEYEKTPPGAVPEWLLAEIGTGYTSQQILKIFDRVHREMIEKIIKVMPDIELLPTMIVDQEVPREPKGYAKRKSAAHQRSQSLGGALRMSHAHAHSTSPQSWDASSMYTTGSGPSAMSSQKRKRLSSHEEEPSYTDVLPSMHTSQRPRISSHSYSHSSVPLRSTHFSQLYQHPPAYSKVYEHHLPGTSRRPSEDYYRALTIPTPQRLSPYPHSTASHLDAGLLGASELGAHRRPVHQRSHSDMSAFFSGSRHGVYSDRPPFGPAGIVRN